MFQQICMERTFAAENNFQKVKTKMKCIATTRQGYRCQNPRRRCRSTCHVHRRDRVPAFDAQRMGPSLGRGYRGQVFVYGDQDMVVKRIPSKRKSECMNEAHVGKKAGIFCVGPAVHQTHSDDTYCFIVMDRVTPVGLRQEDKEEVVALLEKCIRHKIVNVDGEFARTMDGDLVLYDYGVSEIAASRAEARERYEDYLSQFGRMMGVKGVYEAIYGDVKGLVSRRTSSRSLGRPT